jgi:hypothetical protein
LAAPIVIAVGGGKGMIRRDEVVAAARARAYSKTPWQLLVATTPQVRVTTGEDPTLLYLSEAAQDYAGEGEGGWEPVSLWVRKDRP